MAYSKKLLEILKSKGVSEGDFIRIDKSGVVYEGMLMPRATGDEDALVLKLKSGYNVGVALSDKAVLQKVANAKEHKPEKPALKQHKASPKITLVSTGGTITSKLDYSTGGVITLTKPEELVAQFPDLLDACNLRKITTPMAIMSEDFTPKEWISLAEEVFKELKESDGVIVTHGTDTLGYTAAALSFMISTGKTIAVVGAQRSGDRGSFDGAMNLSCAAHFIGKAKYPGVCVVMHGSSSDDFCYAHRGTKVRKMHSSRRDAFQSINDLPLAKITSDGKIDEAHFEAKPQEEKLDAVFNGNIALVKAYPNANPEVLDWLVQKGAKGIIIEGTGMGHVPTSSSNAWIPHVKKIVDAGVFIGITTQTIYGSVNPFVYSNLRKLSDAGAVFLKDGLPETMYMKLGWVLAHKNWDVKEKMLENMRGEFNPRLKDSDFKQLD